MHRYSTPGLFGLNDLMTQVSIRKANLTWHKRSRPSKEYRLFTRCRACIYVFVALKYCLISLTLPVDLCLYIGFLIAWCIGPVLRLVTYNGQNG